jgi:hypothetical protein
MLSFNKEEGFIHCDLFEETTLYPRDEFITVDGEWYRIAGILKGFKKGWCVMLRSIEQPRGVEPLSRYVMLGDQLWAEPKIGESA